MAPETPSPCNGVCRLDAHTRRCLGCKRTLAEIGEWPGAPPARRRAILAALRRR